MPNSLQYHCEPPRNTTTLDADGPRPPAPENSEQFNRLQELFDKSFKAARVGIWECTLPEETITWTDTVYELFGLEPRSPLTRGATVALYAPESRKKLTEIRSAAIRDGEGFTLDAEIITAKGDRRWIRITAIVERQDGIPVRLFGMKQDITAEKTLFEQLRHLAETDVVTGLASRTKFESMLDEVAASSQSEQKALLLIDLDNFKAVNDRLGHQAGDECLREAARRISQAVPDATLIARLGGDEFAVIHDCGAANSVEDVCRRVVNKLEWWVGTSANKLKVSASIGAAMILQGSPAKDIFAEADRALYAVKATGKNSFKLLPRSGPIADVA
ncbi:diguanylate cyclase (GGDEF)-like protein/PAS domain S-box-containing protein [Pararhizobium capsulatum DSM 1112]|uniref:Diguanylate cyclase (GGDEF)-like protein/PAS domain S-box-containing protein n=1 Tax=Pararhizobium capsulatum DSM 1112 TaxID=1121113 RepID=A0ABU0BVW4_9HYPH|nr:diguanylate cyclase [Pararhizobium capsulatum]MDQ0320992.1 diguanylate cyclase (GGDEF)-like protein/PAS domain S-box-containing protein [Pararhizobium capsulatum DSM 1112]